MARAQRRHAGGMSRAIATVWAMDVEYAIRSRRTHKVFASDPLPRELVDGLLDVGRWAPNHRLTNPWRFRVVGPLALAGLKEVASADQASKLDRAPTLVAAT